jgi:methyl-accepting chemotaxis protein
MAFFKKPFGLLTRLIVAFSAVIVLIVACLAWIVDRKGRDLAEAALVNRSSAITEVSAKLIAPAVAHGNPQEVQGILQVMNGHPDLRYTMVIKANGEVMAQWSQSALGPGEMVLQQTHSPRVVLSEGQQGLVNGLAPVVLNNLYLGTMVMGFSRQSISQAIHASHASMLGMALMVLFLGVLVALLVARNLQSPIRLVASRLSQLSQDLVTAARNQETAGAQQAGGIEQTRRTMDRVRGSAQQIADRSSQVLGNAERTVMGNRAVAVRIKELNGQAERASEILGAIMQVADRTDLLALNAALEGTKAGEAGRGFTLVAAEMRRLAESTMESVNGIRQLMNDMRAASQVAVQAGHEGVALSEETTRSARDIAMETQQQRKATEDVGRSMDDMAGSVSETMSSTRRTASHAAELAQVATNLSLLVGGSASVRKIAKDVQASASSDALRAEGER